MKDSYNLSRVSIAAGAAALADYDVDARARAPRPRDAGAPERAAARRAATRCRRATPTSSWRASPGRDQRAVYEALKQRRILVRYFATPELHDALRITVGTDEEIDALLAALDEISVAGSQQARISPRRR